MKSTIRTRRLLPWMGGLLFLVACQKEQSASPDETIKTEPGGIKVSGLVPADPKKLEQVPLIISSQYVTSNSLMVAGGKGRKGGTTGGTTDGGTSGGTTGGTTGGDTTVVQPPTTNFPSSFSLNMPPVGYQGSEFNCAVFSTVYAARSAEQFYKTNASSYSYSTNIFSPEFVYNQTKISSDCGSGTGVTLALDFMKNTGAATWQAMPYSYINGCSLMPNSAQTAEAANYRIASYSKILSSDRTAIKTMLVNKHPVIISIDPDQSFYDAQPGFIWKTYSGARSASHALVICGYDDARHAYKVMNSWGTGWGDAGYSWIDYDFFPQTAFYYSYVINL